MLAESVRVGVVGVVRPSPKLATLRIVGAAEAPPVILPFRSYAPSPAPDTAEPLTRDGDAHADSGRWDEARSSYESALAENPRFGPARVALGRISEWGGLDRPSVPRRTGRERD